MSVCDPSAVLLAAGEPRPAHKGAHELASPFQQLPCISKNRLLENEMANSDRKNTIYSSCFGILVCLQLSLHGLAKFALIDDTRQAGQRLGQTRTSPRAQPGPRRCPQDSQERVTRGGMASEPAPSGGRRGGQLTARRSQLTPRWLAAGRHAVLGRHGK